MADWMVRQLPPDSRVAVLDSRAITPVFSIDLAAARKTIQRVKTTGAPRPLDQLLDTALQLVRQSSLKRKEIYVYTDLSAAAWQIDEAARLQRKFREADGRGAVLDRCGRRSRRRTSRWETWSSPSRRCPKTASLTVSTTISCIGSGGSARSSCTWRTSIPRCRWCATTRWSSPTSRLQSRQEVTLEENGSQADRIRRCPSLALGTRHAELRIVGQDALPIDNSRFLSVQVRTPWSVLVVAPTDVNTSAFVEAIAPYEHRVGTSSGLRMPGDHTRGDPQPQSGRFRRRGAHRSHTAARHGLGTARHVRAEGGQLALFLGHSCGRRQLVQYHRGAGVDARQAGSAVPRLRRDVYLAPHSYDHPDPAMVSAPLLPPYPGTSSPSSAIGICNNSPPTHRSSCDTATIGRHCWNDGRQGTVLTMTTPITEPERPRGRQAWNELAGPNDWPRFKLVNETDAIPDTT